MASTDPVRIGDATLYLGDCLEILPTLGPVDAVVTDPPWPMKDGKSLKEWGRADVKILWARAAQMFDAKRILIWLGIHNDPRDFLNPLADWPYLRSLYIRRAIPGYFGRVLMDGEMIFALGEWPLARKGRMVIPGGMAITYIKSDRPDNHPAPRSQIATDWLVNWWSDEGNIILDPFMGSGTTGVACARLGRKFIGIEIEPKYFDIACKRIQREYEQLKLFPPEEKREAVQFDMEDTWKSQ